MPRIYGDEDGLFWQDPIPEKSQARYERGLPPIPETGWKLPADEDLFKDLSGQGAIAVDVESNDPDLRSRGSGFARGQAELSGIALATEAGFRQYFPIAHAMGDNLPKEKVLAYVAQQLALPVAKVGASLSYDLEALETNGVKVAGPHYDIQIAEPLLNENRFSYSLESIAQRHLGEGKRTDAMYDWLEAAFGAKNLKGNIWRAPATVVGPYAESDVDLPLRVFAVQKQLLQQDNLWELFQLESRLIPLLVAMRIRGVPVDLDKAEQLRGAMSARQGDIQAEIKRISGVDADIWASDSLARVFDALGEGYPRTAKGAPSFRKEWLEHNPHPVAKLVKDARKLDKFRGTFIESYILNGHVNGKVHCNFNQLRSDDGGTISGRFSSSNPNLQNIPVRDKEFGPALRAMFIPEAGHRWWAFDWSQIEYRLIAHYAHRLRLRGAEVVVDRYRNDPNVDYHQAIADMTGLPRSSAKNLNFGLAYGQGVELLCYNLGVGREEGEKIIARYHQESPFIRALMRATSRHVEKHGVIRTLLQRARHFDAWEGERVDPETGKSKTVYLDHHEPGFKRAFLHATLNALIQGSAADIMKLAMVMCWEAGCFAPDVLGAPHLTVHDELDGSTNDSPAAQEALRTVKDIMENCVTMHTGKPLFVPLVAEGGLGANWAEAK